MSSQFTDGRVLASPGHDLLQDVVDVQYPLVGRLRRIIALNHRGAYVRLSDEFLLRRETR